MTQRRTIPNGTRFGRLTVIGVGEPKGYRSTSIVKCDCGKVKTVTNYSLTCCHVKSCGCEKGANLKTHGESKTRLFKIWANMIERCTTDKPRYRHYYGKGIRVCDEWLHDFKAFRSWSIGNGYADDLSIDRIDPNGNYDPSNCRWVSMRQQMNNRTTSVFLSAFGERHTISEWARITGINEGTIRSRIAKYHWTPEKALTKTRKDNNENNAN